MSEPTLPDLNEETFQIQDAKPLLEQMDKYAKFIGAEFNLEKEMLVVNKYSRPVPNNNKIQMFSFLKPNPKVQVFNVVWSARERLVRDINENNKMLEKLGKMEPISYEVYGEWEVVVLPGKVSLYLWPERYRDGKKYAYRPDTNEIYFATLRNFAKQSFANDWKLADIRTTLRFLEVYQPEPELPLGDPNAWQDSTTVVGAEGEYRLEYDPSYDYQYDFYRDTNNENQPQSS